MEVSKISDAEMEVMKIIWSSEKSMSSGEISEQLPKERKVKITTLLTFLSRLTEKGLLDFEKKGRKNYYYSIVSEEAYRRFESRQFLSAVHGGSVKSFLAALSYDEMTDEELDELKRWLAENQR